MTDQQHISKRRIVFSSIMFIASLASIGIMLIQMVVTCIVAIVVEPSPATSFPWWSNIAGTALMWNAPVCMFAVVGFIVRFIGVPGGTDSSEAPPVAAEPR